MEAARMKATTRSFKGATCVTVMNGRSRSAWLLTARARHELRGDARHVFALIAAHFQFELCGHARFAAGSGNTACAVGGAARDFAHRRQILERVRQPDNDHAVMEQRAMKRRDR